MIIVYLLIIGAILFATYYIQRLSRQYQVKRREEYEETHSAAEVQKVRWRIRFVLLGIALCVFIYALVTGNWNVFFRGE